MFLVLISVSNGTDRAHTNGETGIPPIAPLPPIDYSRAFLSQTHTPCTRNLCKVCEESGFRSRVRFVEPCKVREESGFRSLEDRWCAHPTDGHADAEARRSVLTALPCATLVTARILGPLGSLNSHHRRTLELVRSCAHPGGSGGGQRESSLLTTYWSESTLSSR